MRPETEHKAWHWYLYLDSGDGAKGDYPGAKIIGNLFNKPFSFRIPQVIKPYRFYSEYKGKKTPVDVSREYGIYYINGSIGIKYGRDAMDDWDSDFKRSKLWFLPWMEYRHIGFRICDLEGNIFLDGKAENAEKLAPKIYFQLEDFDGEALLAVCHREIRMWEAGEGWFKWLSYIRKPIVHRTLEMAFSSEVGRKKGSYKGGTIGTSTEMLGEESNSDAIARYCKKEGLKYVEALSELQAKQWLKNKKTNWYFRSLSFDDSLGKEVCQNSDG